MALPGMIQVMGKSPIALRLIIILRGSPGPTINILSEGFKGKPSTQFFEVGLSASRRGIDLCC